MAKNFFLPQCGSHLAKFPYISVVYNILPTLKSSGSKYACHYCCAHARCGYNYCSYHNISCGLKRFFIWFVSQNYHSNGIYHQQCSEGDLCGELGHQQLYAVHVASAHIAIKHR